MFSDICQTSDSYSDTEIHLHTTRLIGEAAQICGI